MKTELKEISPTLRELKIEVEPSVLKNVYGRISRKYADRATVPGFRRGNAPLDVVRLRFRDEIRNDVLQDVVPPALAEALQEHDLQPLSEPALHVENIETVKVNGSEPVSFHVHVEIMPEIAVPAYTGLELTRRVKPVADPEVEDLIAERLQEYAALLPVEDRPSQNGDTVIVDLEGVFADDPEGQPITATDLEVVLGSGEIERSFTENLAGVRQDDEKDFTVEYAKDFTSEALAGKTVHYKAKVKSVGIKETPELNDDWAKSLDEGYESLADLRSKLRADLQTMAEANADARLRNDAVTNLIENNAFEVPNTLIESQLKNLMGNLARDLQQRGVDLRRVENDFIQMAYMQMRPQAERDVRGALLLEKIVESEKIEIGQQEVDDEIGKIADYYRMTPDAVRESIEKQGGDDSIKSNLRTRRAMEILVEKANVVDGEWIDESAVQVEPDEGKPEKTKGKSAAGKSKAEKPEKVTTKAVKKKAGK